jgi:squalene synthase HpnC
MNLFNFRLRRAQFRCLRTALTHYENFFVLGPLTPLRLIPHIAALYAFSRHADDLADETEDPTEAARKLEEWRAELKRALNGEPTHPITFALKSTADRFRLPESLFFDLLDAFKQDTAVSRFRTFSEVRDYTRRSADPVGRLVLRLYGYDDPELDVLSDRLCTGLQLANFCQDVGEDAERGRIYIPLDECRNFDVDPVEILERRSSPRMERLLHFQNVRAYKYLLGGLPLAERLKGRLKISVRLFALGGLRILEKLRDDPQAALYRRVTLTGSEKRGTLLASLSRPRRLLQSAERAFQLSSNSLL